MSLESELKSFIESYSPTLELLEKTSKDECSDDLKEKIKKQISEISTPNNWELIICNRNEWFKDLLIESVIISAQDNVKLTFSPTYQKDNDKVYWNNHGEHKEEYGPTQYDMRIEISPRIKPVWENDGHRLRDWRTGTSEYGHISGSIEEGSAVFYSHKREKKLEEEKELPHYFIDDDGEIQYRSPKKLVLIKVGLDYEEVTEGMSDEEMGRIMTNMYAGYSHIARVKMDSESLGEGELESFLKHVGIQYNS